MSSAVVNLAKAEKGGNEIRKHRTRNKKQTVTHRSHMDLAHVAD